MNDKQLELNSYMQRVEKRGKSEIYMQDFQVFRFKKKCERAREIEREREEKRFDPAVKIAHATQYREDQKSILKYVFFLF